MEVLQTVHFPRKLLIFDLRFDRMHQVRHERVRPPLGRRSTGENENCYPAPISDRPKRRDAA